MIKILFLVCIFLIPLSGKRLYCSATETRDCCKTVVSHPDSLRERQRLFVGTLWKNEFRRITGDPFLFTNIFLPGSVTFNGKTFENLLVRYDIFSDEIMIPRNLDQIIILNKEMVDSFSLVFNNRSYRFVKIKPDSIAGSDGFMNVLYNDRSGLYLKFRKNILTNITDESDGEFYQVSRIYIMDDQGIFHSVRRLKDFYGILQEEKEKIKEFIRQNKIKVSRKDPESLVPVIRFYDSIKKKNT